MLLHQTGEEVVSTLIVLVLALNVNFQLLARHVSLLLPRFFCVCKKTDRQKTISLSGPAASETLSNIDTLPGCMQSLRSGDSSFDSTDQQPDNEHSLEVLLDKPSWELSVLSNDQSSSQDIDLDDESISLDDLQQVSEHEQEKEKCSEREIATYKRLGQSDSRLLLKAQSMDNGEADLRRSEPRLLGRSFSGEVSFDAMTRVSERVKRRFDSPKKERKHRRPHQLHCRDLAVKTPHTSTRKRQPIARMDSFGSRGSSQNRQQSTGRRLSTSFIDERSIHLRETMKRRGLSRNLKTRSTGTHTNHEDMKILQRLHLSGLSSSDFDR